MKKWLEKIGASGLCMAGGFLAALVLLFVPMIKVQGKWLGFLNTFRDSDVLETAGEFGDFIDKGLLFLKVIFIFLLLVYLAGIVLYLLGIGKRVKYAAAAAFLLFPVSLCAVSGSLILMLSQMGSTVSLYGIEVDIGLSASVGPGWVLFLAVHLFLLGTALVYLCTCSETAAAGQTGREDLRPQKYGKKQEPHGRVYVNCGEYKGQYLPMAEQTPLIIGRNAAGCNLVLEGSGVSRIHVEITYLAGEEAYAVTDYSSNGTFLKNGTRLPGSREVLLKPGTEIYLGQPQNSFRLC